MLQGSNSLKQIKESALPKSLRPKLIECILSLAAAVDVNDQEDTENALLILKHLRSVNLLIKEPRFGAMMDRLQTAAQRHAAEEMVLAFMTACDEILSCAEEQQQIQSMLALREKLPAADGRQRLALQNKEGRNTAW